MCVIVKINIYPDCLWKIKLKNHEIVGYFFKKIWSKSGCGLYMCNYGTTVQYRSKISYHPLTRLNSRL